MTNKPQHENDRNPAVPEGGPAVESVRTTKEAEAVVTKWEAERNSGEASGVESEPRPAGDSPKPHGDKFENTFSRETPDEPVVEDEP